MKLKIVGQRINLRKLKKSDAVSIYQNVKARRICRYTHIPYPYKLQYAEDFIRKSHQRIRKKTAYELGIELKQTHQIIGMMSLMHIDSDNRNGEVGYWLGKKYWGQGFAKEALGLILDFGFKELNLVKIYARVMHPNIASSELLETCGFQYEGRMRKNTLKDGEWLDDLRYSILKEEWNGVEA